MDLVQSVHFDIDIHAYLARIELDIVPPKTSPNNLIYTLTPQISLIDAQSNPQTESLNQLKATFAFADTNQFTCYTLQGDTFIPVGQGLYPQPWCL